MRNRPFFALLLAVPLLLHLGSCSQQAATTEIQPGTPAFFWAAARDAHSKGDFVQAVDNLRHITSSSNEYRERAEAWLMTLSAGIARGDMEWSDALRDGAKIARAKQSEFRKAIGDAGVSANQNAMLFAETAHAAMERGLPAEITLPFTLPALDSSMSAAEAGKIAKGMLPPAAELENMWSQWRRRAVLHAIARASGSGEDLAKATPLLAAGDLKVKQEAWRLNMAREFVTAAEFYSPKKLDHAARAKIMLDEAKEALAPLPPAASKDLKKQWEAVSKKLLKPTT